MKSLTAMLLTALTASAAGAAVLNVPAQYSAIQSAIDAAQPGDTVLVEHGIWENINYRSKGIVVASRFILDGNPAHVDSTVIDGTNPYHPDSASCALITSPSPATSGDTSAALIGFTLRNGQGTVWDDEHNPGSKYNEGGGILIQYLAPRIRHNRIVGNSAPYKAGCVSAGGGAIRCGDGYPIIENNTIACNQAGGYGGAVVLNYSGAAVRNNLVVRNRTGDQFGGGAIWIYNNGMHPRSLENNVISDNRAGPSSTGGVRFWSTTASMQNSVVWGNSPSQMSTQGGSVSVRYSDVQGGFAGTGNLDADPQWGVGRYYLGAGSPCIDAGNDSSLYNDPEDGGNPGWARWPSLGALRNDMGAYGGPGRTDLYPLPPHITATGPEEGQTRVPYDAAMWVAFSQPMDPATVSCELSAAAIALDSSWSQGHDTLFLSHVQPFANFTRYSLRVLSGHGQNGQPLAPVPDSFSFRTLDTVRPRLAATQPADGQSGVAATAYVRLWFSKPIDRNTFSYAFSDTSIHFAVYKTNDSVLTLLHAGTPFAAGTSYAFEVTGIQDTCGNAMNQSLAPNPFTFTTAGTGVEGPSTQYEVTGRFSLSPSSPNPVNCGGRVLFEFSLEEEGRMELDVYDILGHRKGRVHQGTMSAGRHSIAWACRDGRGRPLAAGVYFCRLRAGGRSATGRLVVVR